VAIIIEIVYRVANVIALFKYGSKKHIDIVVIKLCLYSTRILGVVSATRRLSI